MSFSPSYVIVILVLGVLFFGKNLPGVARQLGTSLIEFRKGLNEWKELHGRPSNVGKSTLSAMQEQPEERFESLGTKFEPPS